MVLPISEPAGVLTIVLAIVLIAPFLAEKARVPGIVGLALAGIVVGPHGLGLIAKGGTIEFLGEVGLLYVFFTAGADLDTSQLRRDRRGALAFFPFAFGLPFAAGAAAGIWLLGLGLLPALLLGCVFSASSLLPYPSAARLGLSRQRSVSAASGAAVLANAAAMAALALVARLSAPPAGWPPLLSLALAAAWAAASILILPRAAALFFRKVKPDGTVEFVFILALAFACAYGALLAGIEPMIGAFLAGLLLSRFIPESSVLMNRVRFIGDALLVPFFMIYVGLLADPLQAFGDAASLWAAGLIVVLDLASTWLAALCASLALRFSGSERRMLFGLSASRAAATLAIALAGFKLGIIDRAVLDGSVFLVIAACIAGSAAVRSAGRSLAASGEERAECQSAAPERILVAVSNPSSIKGLIDLSFLLRGAGNKEPIYPVAVIPESVDSEAEIAAAENRLAQAVVQGVSAGVPVIPSARVSVNAPEGVLQAARENRASTILIGWNKAPKLSHAFFGSVIEQVILGGSELVIVARATRPLGDVSHVCLVLPILVERHPGFGRALAALASLVAQSGAKLTAYTLAGHGAEARAALSCVKAHGGFQVNELGSWKELGADAKAPGSAGRVYVLFSARPGEPAWHPAVEKLPHRLGEEFPEAPLLLFYLPEGARAQAPEADSPAAAGEAEPGVVASAPPSDLLDRAIAAGRVRPAMGETAINDGIRELLRSAFEEDRKALGRLSALFTQMAQSQPIELEPGVLLLHAHVEEAAQTMVFFGARPEGFRVLALEEPVRILIILCAPQDQAPEEHLATLGEIAMLFKDGRMAARLGI